MTGGIDAMVLFDWNGTIVLDAERARESLNGVLRVRGIQPLEPDQFAVRFRLPMHEMFRDLGVSEAELEACESEWNVAMAQQTTELRPGAAEALAQLRAAGTWLGVVSAAAAESVEYDQRTLEVPRVWDAVYGATADKLHRLQSERARRVRAFYVGDTEYDIRCAREAGYVAVGVTGGYAHPDVLLRAGADYLISDLTELVTLVVP